MPVYEYSCSDCEIFVERLEFGEEIDQPHPCPVCKKEMKRIISRCSFELKYDARKDICDWSGNTSHYWDAVKKARAEGKDVKPAIDGDKY